MSLAHLADESTEVRGRQVVVNSSEDGNRDDDVTEDAAKITGAMDRHWRSDDENH